MNIFRKSSTGIYEDNNEMFLISPPSTPISPKIQNYEQNLSTTRINNTQVDVKSLTPTANVQLLSDASTISLDLVTSPYNLLQPKCNLKQSSIVTQLHDHLNSSNINTSSTDAIDDAKLTKPQNPDIIEINLMKCNNNGESTVDENATNQSSNVATRKRQSSTVTYNVNVINFGDDNGAEYGPLRSGPRSNSSTSKYFL